MQVQRTARSRPVKELYFTLPRLRLNSRHSAGKSQPRAPRFRRNPTFKCRTSGKISPLKAGYSGIGLSFVSGRNRRATSPKRKKKLM
jgi:hypothetical protein